jgi:hypothetical protein
MDDAGQIFVGGKPIYTQGDPIMVATMFGAVFTWDKKGTPQWVRVWNNSFAYPVYHVDDLVVDYGKVNVLLRDTDSSAGGRAQRQISVIDANDGYADALYI